MKFVGVFFIPIFYVFISVLMDVALFAMVGWSFTYGYLLSLFLIITFAALVSCIPSRVAQICIFGTILVFKVLTVIGNVIAQTMLDELFVVENILAIREALAGADSATVEPIIEIVISVLLFLAFMAVSIYVAVAFKKVRPGYRWRGLLATFGIIIVVAGSFTGTFFLTPRPADNLVDNLSSKRFQLNNFNFNRHKFIRNFGPAMFYTRNILGFMGMRQRTPNIEKFNFIDHENTANIQKLTTDQNVIIIMMEAIEQAAIHPTLTPNLWEIKSRSTWIDGMYSHERTHMNEYQALVGSHLGGQEMWSNFTNVYRPHALPQIFRRAGYEQVASFHAYDRRFYRRDRLMRYDRIGFHKHVDMNGDFYREMELNSDYHFFKTLVDQMAPELDGNGRFFSYILPISAHTPHITSRAVFPNRSGELISVPRFKESFDFVIKNEEDLKDYFPRLRGSARERRGVVAYLTAIHNFDLGLGLLLDRLKDIGQDDNTAIILFSDHFNYGAYIEPYNRGRGGLLTGRDSTQSVIGERIPFIIFNPLDNFAINNNGRRIERFATTLDVYRTIAHLFNIPTEARFTNGVSVLDPDTHSVGIGFLTGFYYGNCVDNGPWRTRDFKNFEGATPSPATIKLIRPTLESHLATMLYLRPFYERNRFTIPTNSWYTLP